MSGNNVWVVNHPEGWAVKSEGSERAASVHTTQGDAIQAARDMAKRRESELIIQGENGQIRERNSYGKDPFPPAG